jgi:hypothetical protein
MRSRELKGRVEAVTQSVLRDVRGTANPSATWEQERGRIESVANEVNARFDELALHHCAD